MTTRHQIYVADSRDMREVACESVHLVVTSPPYWQLKDYGQAEQIGFYQSYEEYVNNLNLVWNECYRVLHPGCRLCINIGDQFARSVYYGRYKVIPIRTEIIKFCETIGLDYMGAVIWQKVTTTHTTGGATVMGSFPYPRNGILKLDYEFILIFKKLGIPPKVNSAKKHASALTTEEWNEYFNGHWYFPGERQLKHLAMFPEELPRRLIRMFTFVGETVLDPFLGSGTTSLAARNLGRNSIGYEINKRFETLIQEKLGALQSSTLDSVSIHKPQRSLENLTARISALPYVFRDPLKLDKKIDPRNLPCGSRIAEKQASQNINSYLVKAVETPEILVLHPQIKIRLIGVRTDPGTEDAAITFLREKAQGKRVFLKFDLDKYDEKNYLRCYVYLENKTFLNAHLIKRKLAKPDRESSYRLRNKFLSYNGGR